MGWADCGTDDDGRPIGYAFQAECDWPGCEAEIDRGLSYVCGGMHCNGETCAGYFCADHLCYTRATLLDPSRQVCLLCYAFDLIEKWDEPCADDCGACVACEQFGRGAANAVG